MESPVLLGILGFAGVVIAALVAALAAARRKPAPAQRHDGNPNNRAGQQPTDFWLRELDGLGRHFGALEDKQGAVLDELRAIRIILDERLPRLRPG